MGGSVRACPECGRPVRDSCYHEGEDVRSREMSEDQARALRLKSREALVDQIESLLQPGDLDNPRPVVPGDSPNPVNRGVIEFARDLARRGWLRWLCRDSETGKLYLYLRPSAFSAPGQALV